MVNYFLSEVVVEVVFFASDFVSDLVSDFPSDGLESPSLDSVGAFAPFSEGSGFRESLIYQPEPLNTMPTG